MPQEKKPHERSAELIAASNAYYRRFANKIIGLVEEKPSAEERNLAELLITGLSEQHCMEVAALLAKTTIRADMLIECLKERAISAQQSNDCGG